MANNLGKSMYVVKINTQDRGFFDQEACKAFLDFLNTYGIEFSVTTE